MSISHETNARIEQLTGTVILVGNQSSDGVNRADVETPFSTVFNRHSWLYVSVRSKSGGCLLFVDVFDFPDETTPTEQLAEGLAGPPGGIATADFDTKGRPIRVRLVADAAGGEFDVHAHFFI